jgi:uncharacterized membrane protein
MEHQPVVIRRLRRAAAPGTWSHAERWVLRMIVAATLLFALLTPPFQAPDEDQHYYKSLLLAEGRVLAETKRGLIGAHLPRAATALRTQDFAAAAPEMPERYAPAMLARAWSADAARPGRAFVEFPNVASYAPTLYAPQAAGIALAQAAGLPRLGGFYLGRMVNAAVALALLAMALRLVPFGRAAFLGIAALPTFSYQVGSLSPDAYIDAVAFLALALSLRIGAGASGGGAALLVAPLLALAKGVYLPLMAAGLDRQRGRPVLLVGAMALGALAFVAWMKLNGGSQALYHITSRKTGESVLTAPLADQLRVVLRDPAAFAHVLVTSVAERMPVYLLQLVGRFGWNAILLPLLLYPLAGAMLAVAVVGGGGAEAGAGRRVWWLAVAGGTALLIELAMYLTGTPYAADYIQGTQGRYFIPLLPLALLALMPAARRERAQWAFAGTAGVLLAAALLSAFDSFWVHGFVTRDGMPPGAGSVRSLVMPSPRW